MTKLVPNKPELILNFYANKSLPKTLRVKFKVGRSTLKVLFTRTDSKKTKVFALKSS